MGDLDSKDEAIRRGITTFLELKATVAGYLSGADAEFKIKTTGRTGGKKVLWKHVPSGREATFDGADVETHDPSRVRFRIFDGFLQAGYYYAPQGQWLTVCAEPTKFCGWMTFLAPWTFIPTAADFELSLGEWKEKVGPAVLKFIELDAELYGTRAKRLLKQFAMTFVQMRCSTELLSIQEFSDSCSGERSSSEE